MPALLLLVLNLEVEGWKRFLPRRDWQYLLIPRNRFVIMTFSLVVLQELSVQPPNAVDVRWFYERAVMYVMRLVFVGDEESAPSLLLQQRLLSCRCQCCLWMRSTQLTKSHSQEVYSGMQSKWRSSGTIMIQPWVIIFGTEGN